MTQRENYDVLRLIEHGQICYISSDNVQGKTLARYLKYHPIMEKKEIFSLLREIAKQLDLIHHCRGNPCYQYVNPYSIILAEDGQVYFLDMQAETNREQMVFMQRRDIRDYFLPPEENYYQHASKELDLYGLGKTFQYILASVESEPKLGRGEERRLRRMISKAMGEQSSHYQNISELQKQIPSYKEKIKKDNYRDKRKIRKKVWIMLVLFLSAGGYLFVQQRKSWVAERKNEVKLSKSDHHSQKKHTEGKSADRSLDFAQTMKKNERDEEYLELAMAYFLNVGDIEKSLKCLNEMEDASFAKCMKLLIRSYEKQEVKEQEEYQKNLEYLHSKLKKRSETSEEKKKQEIQCLVRGYSLLKNTESADEVLRLVKEGLQMEYLNDAVKKELLQYQAAAYENLDKKEEAAKIYTELLETETQPGNREQLYKVIVRLYEATGRRDMAGDICVQGIKEFETSEELKVLHMRMLCIDPAVSREECAQKIKEYMGSNPELVENEEFKKLQREYEIRLEGENVWVGR